MDTGKFVGLKTGLSGVSICYFIFLSRKRGHLLRPERQREKGRQRFKKVSDFLNLSWCLPQSRYPNICGMNEQTH